MDVGRDDGVVGGAFQYRLEPRGIRVPNFQGAAQLQQRHDLPGQALHRLDLLRRELPRSGIEHAEGPDRYSLLALENRPGIEAQLPLAGDQRVAAEARICGRIRDQQEIVFLNGDPAEGDVQLRLVHP